MSAEEEFTANTKEYFTCKCGKSYPDLAGLQAHWADPDRGPGLHFRLMPEGTFHDQ